VSKSRTSAPLGNVRRVKRRGDTLRGILATLLVLAIAGGIPAGLVLLAGNPIPKLPEGGLLSSRVTTSFILDVIVCIVWLAWAQLMACLITELVAGVRGSGLPWRVPFAAAAQQDLARRLVTAMLLVATAGQGLHSAPGPSGPAVRPAAATASVGGAMAQVAAATVGQADAAAQQATAAALAQHAAPAGGASSSAHVRPVKQYIVMPPQGRHHDSLWDIADRYLGSGIRYKEIFELNRGRLQPDGERLTLESLIRPGWTLVLPTDAQGDGLIEVTPTLQARAPVAPAPASPESRVGGGAEAGGAPSGLQSTGAEPGSGVWSGSGAQSDSPMVTGVGTQVGPGGMATALGDFARDTRGLAGAEEPAPERAPNIPWDVVGAELLAAGLLEALVALRRRRSRFRVAGGPVAVPDADAAGVEVAVRLGADPAGAQFLDRALRALAAALAEQERPVPEVYAARLSDGALELLLAVPQEKAPAPFLAENGGRRWVLERSALLPPTDGAPAPLPGLVSIGGDGYGRVFVDLEAAGGAICVEGDLDRARSVVAAAAVELVTNRWSDNMRVTLVGFGSGLAPISDERLRCVDSLDEVLEGVTDRLSASWQTLAASGVDSVLTGRVRGLGGDGVTPDYLVFAGPPPPQQLAELEEWSRSVRRAPLGILIAGSVETARWRFTIDGNGQLSTGVLGITVGAQLLTARSYAALARLLRAEAEAMPEAEPTALASGVGWTGSGWAPGWSEPALRPTLPRPLDLDAEPAVLVRLFGEPVVEGRRGTLAADPTDDDGGDDLPPGTPQAVEIVSFISLVGAVTPRALASAIWPYGVTVAERDATLSRVREWLGTDAEGRPRLRLDEDGRLRLADEVQLDWHRFVALADRATDVDVLAALELARAPLATPHPPRRYTWLARDRVSHELPAYAVDVAHRLARSYLEVGNFDGAVAAARAGLHVEPICELLWDDLIVAVRERDGAPAADRIAAEREATLSGTDRRVEVPDLLTA
jgi:LysM domain